MGIIMGVDITIKQKGSSKKEISLAIILGDNLEVGYFDGVRLGDDEESGYAVAYNPNLIARGIVINFSEDKMDVDLRLSFPTSEEEIGELISMVKRITEFCECDIEVDSESVLIDELEGRRQSFENGSMTALVQITKAILADTYEYLLIYGAMWTLFIGEKEVKLFSKSEKLSTVRDYLHEKQNIDAYYAKPMFYKDKNSGKILAMYVLSEDTRSIFPMKGYMTDDYRDYETGEFPFEADEWKLTFVQSNEESHEIIVDYNKFMETLPDSSKTYFDARSVLIESVTVAEYEKIAEKNKGM